VGQEFLIESFTLRHYEAVYDLWDRCPGVGLSSADARDCIASYLERNPGMSFIALAGANVIGAILGGHDGRRGYIHHLAVEESYRRQGIGRQLVENCLKALEGAGIQKCHLFIFHENDGGIAFWETSDWTLRQDIMVMSKRLVNKEPGI
jgi:ribosomal protein S18 acetylase RimI-like enzyme